MTILSRYILAIVAIAAAAAPLGCGTGGTFAAMQLIEPQSESGKGLLRLTGSPEWLIKQGRIDAHRRIATADGSKMDVWIIHARVPKGTAPLGATALVIHGLTSSKAWFLSLGEDLARAGWEVVLPDLRAHGDSGGTYITWGAVEKYDMKEIVDALIDEEIIPERVYAFGASLGGCVAVQYAAVDPRCEGVMALAPPTGIRGAAKLMWPFSTTESIDSVVSRAGEIAKFDPGNASAVNAAERLKCPIILVHGRWDFVVPCRHSRKIYNAAMEPKKLIWLWLADHTGVQVGRNKWLVEKMRLLMEMAGRGKSQTSPR